MSGQAPVHKIDAQADRVVARFVWIFIVFVLLMFGVEGRAATVLSACESKQYGDFIDETFWAYRRLLPTDCTVVKVNPVTFAWTQPKARDTKKPWILRVFDASTGSLIATRSVAVPRFTFDRKLARGIYSWSVSYVATDGTQRDSAVRSFVIDASTSTCALPSTTRLLGLLTQRTSPRLLAAGATWREIRQAAESGEYSVQFALMRRSADAAIGTPTPEPPMPPFFNNDAERANWLASMRHLTQGEMERLETLAFAWRLTGEVRYLDAAKARLIALADWKPQGASSETSQPQANRNVYRALAIGADLIGERLSISQRARVAAAFEARVADAITSLDRLDATPYLAFENTGIHFTTEAMLLVAGTAGYEGSTRLLPKVWALYRSQFQAFGSDDGGYDGSIAYAWYEMYLISRGLATLALTTGINSTCGFASKFGDFLFAFTAPNVAQLNAFGDGLETHELYRNYSYDSYRLYAAVTRDPAHEWYWRQRPENVRLASTLSPLHFMLLGRKLPPITPVTPTRNDFVFDEVGLVAMHRGAAQSKRSSVFFRASRFGSYGHAHADQNGFTFTSKGANVLISSGYYPYYRSPHHANVTRATRYKNAVTFDGGIGQAEATPDPYAPTAPISSMDTRGRLLEAWSDPVVAVASGDATLAYRGWDSTRATWKPLLTGAVRSVAHLKNDGVVVIYDRLSSVAARQWEWNYHGVEPFTQEADALVAHNGATRACITHHGIPGAVTTTAEFDFPPENGGANQGHARFTARHKSIHVVAVAILREDCQTIPINVTFNGDVARVTIGTRTMIFDRGRSFRES